MSLWAKIKNFFFPKEPVVTYVEEVARIVEEEKKAKAKKPRAKKEKDEKLP